MYPVMSHTTYDEEQEDKTIKCISSEQQTTTTPPSFVLTLVVCFEDFFFLPAAPAAIFLESGTFFGCLLHDGLGQNNLCSFYFVPPPIHPTHGTKSQRQEVAPTSRRTRRKEIAPVFPCLPRARASEQICVTCCCSPLRLSAAR